MHRWGGGGGGVIQCCKGQITCDLASAFLPKMRLATAGGSLTSRVNGSASTRKDLSFLASLSVLLVKDYRL